MIQATYYIGGFFAGAWTLLVLFVAVRSFSLSLQQRWNERQLLSDSLSTEIRLRNIDEGNSDRN